MPFRNLVLFDTKTKIYNPVMSSTQNTTNNEPTKRPEPGCRREQHQYNQQRTHGNTGSKTQNHGCIAMQLVTATRMPVCSSRNVPACLLAYLCACVCDSVCARIAVPVAMPLHMRSGPEIGLPSRNPARKPVSGTEALLRNIK